MDEPRRLQAPWQIIEHAESYEITDMSGSIRLAFVYFEDEPGRQRATHRLTKDEARRLATHIARIPDYIVMASPLRSTPEGDAT